MSKPVNCRYFYGDYHRGRNVEECRLIEANRESPHRWQRKHCDSCPVPELLIASNSRELLLEGEVQRVLFPRMGEDYFRRLQQTCCRAG